MSFFTDITAVLGSSFLYPGASFTHAAGIDSSGQVIGQFIDFSTFVGGSFLRSPGGTFSQFPDPSPGVAPTTEAISSNGKIVLSSGSSMFFWNGSTYTPVAVPGAGSSLNAANVTGIDNSGDVVGYAYTSSDIFSFFRDNGGTFQTIKVPGSVSTQLMGMNNVGQAVGLYYDGTSDHGFIWSGGGNFTTLDFPGASNTYLYGINDAGYIVGAYADDAGALHGLITDIPEPGSMGLGAGSILAISVLRKLRVRRRSSLIDSRLI